MEVSSKEKEKMIRYVIEEVCYSYGLSEADANKVVRNSVFAKMLRYDPVFAGHYSARYWAETVYAEYLGLPTE